jgi:nanoRNase/pAp phosphatase (c-di-AMP/oligoRNAs hydrolase)
MLTESEISEIMEEMKSTKRPLIFFDDDTDGLCSFLIFYKFMKPHVDDIKGMPIKDSHELKSEIFLRKIEEFQPDKVFILDKPLVSQDFLDKIKVRTIWLDHHPLVERNNVKYYNPLKHKHPDFVPDNRPTTYWAYKIVNDPGYMWIAMIGCTADWHVPEFAKEYSENNSDLLPKDTNLSSPGYIFFGTPIGKLCKIFQFNMKCDTQDSLKAIKILTRINDPRDILNQSNAQAKIVYSQYEKINKLYERVKSEIKPGRGKMLFHMYRERVALSQDLSTEMQFFHPNKVVIIAREKDDVIVCSLRSQKHNIREILEKSLVGIDGHGGGHDHACGAGIKKEDFPKFMENFKKNLNSIRKPK